MDIYSFFSISQETKVFKVLNFNRCIKNMGALLQYTERIQKQERWALSYHKADSLQNQKLEL